MYIALSHLLIVAPLLIYVGLTKPSYAYIYYVVLAFGMLVGIGFMVKVVSKGLSERTIWYLIHAILFSSLLLYVGWNGSQSSDVAFSLLLAIGLAAFAYHAVRLIQHRFHIGKK